MVDENVWNVAEPMATGCGRYELVVPTRETWMWGLEVFEVVMEKSTVLLPYVPILSTIVVFLSFGEGRKVRTWEHWLGLEPFKEEPERSREKERLLMLAKIEEWLRGEEC